MMKNREDIVRDKINAIEKRVVELKFLERDIRRERDIIRFPLLENAERSARVESLIESFFVRTMNLNRKSVSVTSMPSVYSGRGEDEFLSEIRVEISYRPEKPEDYNELSLTVYLKDGFDDNDVRRRESEMMDRLLETASGIERLREEKRGLRE
ncbi:MAG TPA: hypothetical protein PK358_07675 [Spirochaetota bacterium]|nr:hypothetical protein [Spirochaetota bacterium]HPJ34698.1 hypothetical protein [Spirochaetota bacterium]